MKLFLSFILLGYLIGLIFTALNFKRRYLGIIDQNAYDFFKSKVPKSIENVLESLNKLAAIHRRNVENIGNFKKDLANIKSSLSLDEIKNLLKTENEVMLKHYKTLNELEETQNMLYKSLKTKGAIVYNKRLGKFEYTQDSKVTDILESMRTYLPFYTAISLKLTVPIKTLPLRQQNMITKYDEVMKHIMLTNTKLNTLDYICNDFVLDNPGLNQIKNKLMRPAVISMFESQKKIIEEQKILLEEIKQFFTRNSKYTTIHTKLKTEQAKLEGELFFIMQSLEKLKTSQSVTVHEGAQLLRGPMEKESTIYVDMALEHFQDQQKILYDKFRLKNGEGKSVKDLNKGMNKLTESRENIKQHLEAMISTILRKKSIIDASNYEDPQYTELRNIIIKYVSSYQKTGYIEHMYKSALKYLTENHSLKGLAIPYIDLVSKRLDNLSPEEKFAFNSLAPFDSYFSYRDGQMDSSMKEMLEDLNDTHTQDICVSKLCLLAIFVVILAILITIIKAKV